MDEELFHKIALQVEKDFMCGGLTDGLYEDFAKEILVRYLAAQASEQTDGIEVADEYGPPAYDQS